LEGRQFWTTRYLGKFPGMTVDEARTKARAWLSLIDQGRDPAAEAKRDVRARLDRATFAQAAQDFIAKKLPSERRGKVIEHIIMSVLIPAWDGRLLAEIDDLDVIQLLHDKVSAGKIATGRNLLVLCKRLFGWLKAQRVYGLKVNPAADIRPSSLFGEANVKDRTLNPDEIRALWIVSGEEGYPVQQIYRLLMLTGLRLREVVEVSGPEFDFAKRDWTIPKERMKGKNHKARPHLVPLTSAALQILGQLPTFEGQYLFSLSCGKKPVTMPQRIKRRIDERMLKALKEMAVERGDDPDKVVLTPWTNHDIRRTVRSELSELRDRRGHPFPLEVREAVVAHAKTGVVGVYDRYDFAQEKFECLEAWAERLLEIVENKTCEKVITLVRRA